VYNDKFDQMDSVMRASAKKFTPWKEDLFFTVKLARQKLSKYYAEVTPTTGMLLISSHILDPFWKLWSYWKWDKGMYTHPEDKTSYTTQYHEALLKYVENEYCAKPRGVPVNKHECLPRSNLVPSATASGSCQSLFDQYDLSSNDEEYLTPNSEAEMTPGWSDRTARLCTPIRLYLNLPPEAPENWGQIDPNLNDYHSGLMEITITSCLPNLTDWWHQQEQMLSKYAALSYVARNILLIIPHGVRLEASFSLGWDVISWRQSKTTGDTLRENVIERQFARAHIGILAGADPELDTTNTEIDSEMKKVTEESKLHRMAKVHNFLEMWQGSQNLWATKKESGAQHEQITVVGFSSDME